MPSAVCKHAKCYNLQGHMSTSNLTALICILRLNRYTEIEQPMEMKKNLEHQRQYLQISNPRSVTVKRISCASDKSLYGFAWLNIKIEEMITMSEKERENEILQWVVAIIILLFVAGFIYFAYNNNILPL